jgi:hypothetical protein
LKNKLPVGQNVVNEAQQTGSPGDSSFWVDRLNNTFTGLGVPVTQFTKGQQDAGFRNMEDRMIQDPFFDFNRSQDRFRVYASNRSDGTQSFRVEDKTTGDLVYETQDPRQAVIAAKKIASGG